MPAGWAIPRINTHIRRGDHWSPAQLAEKNEGMLSLLCRTDAEVYPRNFVRPANETGQTAAEKNAGANTARPHDDNCMNLNLLLQFISP